MIRCKEKKIVIFEKFCDIEKHLSWLRKLKKHKIEIFLDEKKSNHYYNVIEEIGKLGFKIRPSMAYKNDADYIFVDYVYYIQAKNEFRNFEKFIVYWDSFIELTPQLYENDKLLCLSTYQIDKYLEQYAINTVKNSARYNYQSVKLDNNNEIGIVGLLPSQTSIDNLSFIEELKQKSFESKKFVSFFWDQGLRGKTVIKALLELGKAYSIVVVSDKKINLDSEKIIVTTYRNENYVMMNAKVNICSYDSESFVKCCYYNQNVLPIFTKYIDRLKENAQPLYNKVNLDSERFYAFTENFVKANLPNFYLEYLVSYDIQHVQKIEQVLAHKYYWKLFANNIRKINNELLGVHYSNDIQPFVDIIINIMQYDSMVSPRKVL